MKKIYIVIGSLIIVGVIAVATYNEINTTSVQQQAIEVPQTQNTDYSKDIEELKEKLVTAENKINSLEDKVALLEKENQDKDELITTLQAKKVDVVNDTKTEKILQQVQNLKVQIVQNEKNNEKQKELIKEKEEVEESVNEYKRKIEEYQKIYKQRIDLESKKRSLEGQIKQIESLPHYSIDEKYSNEKIEELEQKIKTATKEELKERYREAIKQVKEAREDSKKLLQEKQLLEKQLKEVEENIKENNFDERLKALELSEEDNEKFNQLTKRLNDLKEELLKY